MTFALAAMVALNRAFTIEGALVQLTARRPDERTTAMVDALDEREEDRA